MGSSAIRVDPVAEGLGLDRRQYDVNADLVLVLDGRVELEKAPGPFHIARVVPGVQHYDHAINAGNPAAEDFLKLFGHGGVAEVNAVLVEREAVHPDPGFGWAVTVLAGAPHLQRPDHLGQLVSPRTRQKCRGVSDTLDVDAGRTQIAVTGAHRRG